MRLISEDGGQGWPIEEAGNAAALGEAGQDHSSPVVAEVRDLELVAVRVCGQRRHMSML
jgi:hypothetical protein